jgi:threonine/homoserine/homoserine lactone efflux protein
MITSAYLLACIGLLIVPGPTVIFVITRGVSLGRKAALLVVIGNLLAVMCVTLLVVLGLSAILQSVPALFEVIKWSGAAYLVYLGVRALRDKSAYRFESPADAATARQLISQGFLTTLTNPKLAIFFAAFLPQFVQPGGGDPMLQMLTLGLAFAALAFITDSAWGLLAGTARHWLTRSSRAMGALRWVSGATFIGLGLRLALQEK